jgi:gluconate kinase
VLIDRVRWASVQDRLLSKAKWYEAKALECSALAKSARPSFVREIYRKAAVHYDFTEALLRRRIEEAVISPGSAT